MKYTMKALQSIIPRISNSYLLPGVCLTEAAAFQSKYGLPFKDFNETQVLMKKCTNKNKKSQIKIVERVLSNLFLCVVSFKSQYHKKSLLSAPKQRGSTIGLIKPLFLILLYTRFHVS